MISETTCSGVNSGTSWACSGEATLPVPMAQIGSYAITTFAQHPILAAPIFETHVRETEDVIDMAYLLLNKTTNELLG